MALAYTGRGVITEDRTTDQLRQGDVVLNSGMRLVIDREIQSRQYSQPAGSPDYGPVFFTSARIDNWDDVKAEAAAGSDVARFIAGVCDKDTTGGRWTIQGNQLAHWAVVVCDCEADKHHGGAHSESCPAFE